MKLFLSWSGEKSRKVAIALRDWLPCIFQEIKPFVSSEDLRKGKRWLLEMTEQLETATCGIVCLTRNNVLSPWVLFEAGALSKSVKESYAFTLLLDGLRPTDLDGPLSHFQHTSFDENDFRKLLRTINEALAEKRLQDQLLEKLFEKFWPDISSAVTAAFQHEDDHHQPQARPDRELLEEVLTLSRFIARNAAASGPQQIPDEWRKLRKLLSLGVDDLELAPRLVKMLQRAGIANLGSLASRTEKELLALPGFKPADVNDLKDYLQRLDLGLGMRFDESVWTAF
jgi:hypothetical protein